MIAKFNGSCSICSQVVTKGTECRYDGDTKTVQHWKCFDEQTDNPKPSPEAFALTDRLGFIEYRPDMGADGLLRKMSKATNGATAGRPGTQAHRGPHATLFGEE